MTTDDAILALIARAEAAEAKLAEAVERAAYLEADALSGKLGGWREALFAAESREKALREALIDVAPRRLKGGSFCFCSAPLDLVTGRHEPFCLKARAALAGGGNPWCD